MSLATGWPVVVAFVLGALLGGQLIGRLRGTDLRGSGSGNIGATNALRAGGVGFGLLVLAFDLGKGVAAAVLLPLLTDSSTALAWACGAAAILGHVFSPMAGFHGGKGAATAVGVYLALLPLAVLFALPVFALVLIISGYVSLSVLLAGLAIVGYLALFDAAAATGIPGLSAAAIWLFLCWTHRANLGRLLRGTENRFERVRLFHTRRD